MPQWRSHEYRAAISSRRRHRHVGTNAILLGDRIAPDTTQIANSIITVNYADRKPTDPMSTPPSVGVSKYLVVAGAVLYDTPSDIHPLPSGISGTQRSATVLPGEKMFRTARGIKIVSQPIQYHRPRTPSTPFENYYKAKLAAAGWTVDNALADRRSRADIVDIKRGTTISSSNTLRCLKITAAGTARDIVRRRSDLFIFAGTRKKKKRNIQL